jgi:ATP-binding cassette subfamily F protein 3
VAGAERYTSAPVSLVVLENATVSFGARTLFDGLSLRIAEGDRIGLIGPNGSGKSTLLRVLAGDHPIDSGTIRRARGARVAWLPQDLALEGGRGLLDFVRAGVPGRAELEAELARAEARFAEAERAGSEEALTEASARLAELHETLGAFDSLYSEHEATKILAGLGFATRDLRRDVGELSGGWKMRAVLAALLFQRPDVLLLDEPTNHLDMPSVAWVSEFLQRYPRAFVLISHDREFFNEQIRRIVSFEVEGVRQYPGNYEKYLQLRAEEAEVLNNKAKHLEREREKAERFIQRFRAQANKARAVQSRIKALGKLESVETYRTRRTMRFGFPPAERAGHDVVRLEGVCKMYGGQVVLRGVSLTVYRGDRIGIIGPNGAGKTTLLKMIAGELPPSAGSIALGHNVKPSYYAQHHAEALPPRATVYDAVAGVNRELGLTRVRTVLGAFLFSGDDVDKVISVLSGGERARVALARLLVSPGNLLLLDEPTNHLDLESCESLVDALESYDGTMLFVSHNRALLRRLANKIWLVEGGEVIEYPGNLDDYMALSRARIAGEEVPDLAPRRMPGAAKERRSREDEKARKREEARRRALRSKTIAPLETKVEELLAQIAALEAHQAERNARLCDPALALDEKERFALLDALQIDAAKIEELTSRWEHAQEELDAAMREARGG